MAAAQHKRRPWTPEEDDILRRMAAEGRSGDEIAAELGRSSRTAVFVRAQRLGITFDVAAAKARRTAGMIAARRAGRYNLSPEGLARLQEQGRNLAKRLWADPDFRERKIAHIREMARSPEARERSRRFARQIGRKNSAARNLPPIFHEEYRQMMRKSGASSAEVLARLKPRVDAWLSTFEGKLWRVRTGQARLVENVKLARPVTYVPSEGAMT